VDFDSDGKLDILSGSYSPGDLYFFRALADGKFAKGVTLKDKNGANIKVGAAATVFACNWNGSGRLDLLAGNIDGDVLLIPNEGSTDKPAFGKPVKMMPADKSIKADGGDTHPIAADWDDDGKLDLILGADNGSVTWYRNTGSPGAAKLAAGVQLVPKSKMHGDFESANGDQPMRGIRSKVCVTDWNGDGMADLLVGDYSYSRTPPPNLTEAERADREKARKARDSARAEIQSYTQEMQKLGKQPSGASERDAWMQKYSKVQKRFQPAMERYSRSFEAIARYEGQMKSEGFVWLFLRSNATARSR
jgi:hypothetical protein